jgi:hypothetical protein
MGKIWDCLYFSEKGPRRASRAIWYHLPYFEIESLVGVSRLKYKGFRLWGVKGMYGRAYDITFIIYMIIDILVNGAYCYYIEGNSNLLFLLFLQKSF